MNLGCRPSKPSPHLRKVAGLLLDYNGTGQWSEAGIKVRYQQYAEDFGLLPVGLVSFRHTEGSRKWVYPLMFRIVQLMEQGDKAAIAIGLDMIEEDDFFVFGKIIKSNTARALRRSVLSEEQKARVRRRLVAMILTGYLPHEFHEYRKLLRAVGVDNHWTELDAGVDRTNKYVMKIYAYLSSHARRPA